MARSMEVVAGIRDASFRTGLERMKKDSKEFASYTQGLFGGILNFAGIGLGITAIQGAISKLDDISAISKRLAESPQAVQRISHVANKANTDINIVFKSLLRLNAELSKSKPGEDFANVWKQLGINTAEFLAMGPEEQLIALAGGFEKVKESGNTTTAAVEILGSRGFEAFGLLEGGAASLKSELEKVTTATNDQVKAMDELDDLMVDLSNNMSVGIVTGLQYVITGFRLLALGASQAATYVAQAWAAVSKSDSAKKFYDEMQARQDRIADDIMMNNLLPLLGIDLQAKAEEDLRKKRKEGLLESEKARLDGLEQERQAKENQKSYDEQKKKDEDALRQAAEIEDVRHQQALLTASDEFHRIQMDRYYLQTKMNEEENALEREKLQLALERLDVEEKIALQKQKDKSDKDKLKETEDLLQFQKDKKDRMMQGELDFSVDEFRSRFGGGRVGTGGGQSEAIKKLQEQIDRTTEVRDILRDRLEGNRSFE